MISMSRELAERIEQILTGGHGAEAWAPTITELRELLAEQHQGEPVAWLTKCKLSGLVEQAEPNERASTAEYWTDAFPVYDSPKTARGQFDYDRGFAAGSAECDTLRAQMAERDAALSAIREACENENSHGYIDMLAADALSASAEPSAPVDELGALRARIAELESLHQHKADYMEFAEEKRKKLENLLKDREQMLKYAADGWTAVITSSKKPLTAEGRDKGMGFSINEESMLWVLSPKTNALMDSRTVDLNSFYHHEKTGAADLDVIINDVHFEGNNKDGTPYLLFTLDDKGQQILKSLRLVGVTIKGTVMANTEVSGTGHYLASEETLSGHDTND